jgi:predicted ester cyclase
VSTCSTSCTGRYSRAHQGDYEGLVPTGRPIVVTGITILDTADGRIVRDVGETSIAELTEQLRS